MAWHHSGGASLGFSPFGGPRSKQTLESAGGLVNSILQGREFRFSCLPLGQFVLKSTVLAAIRADGRGPTAAGAETETTFGRGADRDFWLSGGGGVFFSARWLRESATEIPRLAWALLSRRLETSESMRTQ